MRELNVKEMEAVSGGNRGYIANMLAANENFIRKFFQNYQKNR